MYKKIILMATFTLWGCSSSVNLDNSYPVDCTAIFKTNQGAAYEERQANIHIERVRIDRFGRRYVQPTANLKVRFYGRWQSEDLFKNYTCKGDSHGLGS
ncbi:hypothetical protein [Klebsiella grimontii]|uniref:hypothetical protein n=1 Tax=Klebsiella grimontii TaxID=2058152 RepID=UPI0012B72434|nr:hypothetical protein [Klebsiella grimontii]